MDAEWGPAQRLSDVFAHPWNMTLGAIQDDSLVREISKRMAEQNKALGINFNFSPSVDVNNNSKNPRLFNLWSIIDKVRIGATYAVILEAFKLGS